MATPQSDLDRLLRIQRTRDYYDDGDIEKEEFNELYAKLQSKLTDAEPKGFVETPLTETNWQNCNPLYCQECGEIMAWIWYTGSLGTVKMMYCAFCFENDIEKDSKPAHRQIAELKQKLSNADTNEQIVKTLRQELEKLEVSFIQNPDYKTDCNYQKMILLRDIFKKAEKK